MQNSLTVALAQKLIQFPSITPIDAGIIDFLSTYITPHGFICQKLVFEDVTNLYARFGNSGKNFCFAGHTDVVPPGNNWSVDPFAGIIKNNMLYGRGASDMKAAIASFVIASVEFTKNYVFNGSISMLISGDEEGAADNGTPKVLQFLKDTLDACVVGEPTCPNYLGEMIKYGRRGSINFTLTVQGKQGHVAYPDLADNPINHLINILTQLKALRLDEGTADFTASNLEITDISVGNTITNVIPREAKAKFNVRFNNLHQAESLYRQFKQVCGKHELIYSCGADAFVGNSNSLLVTKMKEAITHVTSIEPILSTTGGTSDARFIKDYCPVIEFGLVNQTAHHVDEHVAIEDIIKLKEIYYEFLKKYFL